MQREDLNVYEETLAVVGLIGALLGIESVDKTKVLISDFYNEARRLKRSNANTSISIEPDSSDISDGNTSISIERNLQTAQEIIGSNLKGMSVHSFVTNRLPLLDLPDDTALPLVMKYTKK